MLTEHGELPKPARNRLIVRSDRETRVNPIGPRQLKDERAMKFLEDLLARIDAAGAVTDAGPPDFRHASGSGDAMDPVRRLKRN